MATKLALQKAQKSDLQSAVRFDDLLGTPLAEHWALQLGARTVARREQPSESRSGLQLAGNWAHWSVSSTAAHWALLLVEHLAEWKDHRWV